MKRVLKITAACIAALVVFQLGKAGVHRLYTSDSPQVLNTEHFTLHFQNVSRLRVARVAEALERQYQKSTARLLAPAHPRVNVYVHASQDDLVQALGFYTAGGIKGVDTLHVGVLPFPLSWVYPLPETAAHEFVHTVCLNILVQDAITQGRIASVEAFDSLYSDQGKRFDEVYPRWLWESVAMYEVDQFNTLTFNLSVKDGFPTLETLNGPNNMVYHVGYTIGDFIASTWGRETLRDLITSDGDVQGVLGLSKQQFEDQWEAFTRDAYWIF